MAYQDKTLKCRDCNKDFVWSAGEQDFYAQKGFENAPTRCPDCRKARKKQIQTESGPVEMHQIICAACGKRGEVPFEPRDPKSVLCADCFKKKREKESSEK